MIMQRAVPGVALVLCLSFSSAVSAQETNPPPAESTPPSATTNPSAGAQEKLPQVEVIQEQPKQKPKPQKQASKPKKKPAPAPEPVPVAEPVEEPVVSEPATPGTGGIVSGTVNMSPVSGSDLPIEKVPLAVGRANAGDITRTREVPIQNLLQATVPGVVISDTQGNIFQTSVQFRGYEASPVNGIPQGLAVYQNGVRINEAFGDVVNWDFIPDNAIDSITMLGANPIYGLNAIGGAVGITMRDGFNFQGAEFDTRFGSYGRIQGSAAAGMRSGNWAVFGALEGIRDDGWRDFSESEIKRGYADLGFRNSTSEFHVNFTAADNFVGVTAAAPEELLAIDRSRTFTSPQTTNSDMQMVSLNGSVLVAPTLKLSGVTYYRHYKQKHDDGNILEIAEEGCEAGAICVENEELPGGAPEELVDDEGNELESADFPPGAIFGVIDRTGQNADGFGGTLQATDRSQLFGHRNQFVLGVSYDHGEVNYRTSSEFGLFRPKYVVAGTGVILGGDDFFARNLDTTNDYVGVFFSNTFDVTDRLALTVGGRYNYARLDIDNKSEGDEEDTLSGTHTFQRFNPSAGLTYQVFDGLTLYGGYAEANRAPTTAELACADPEEPCLIESALVSDPPLEQVVSKTWELGLRGKAYSFGGEVGWSLGGFWSKNQDDILLIAAQTTGRGFFDNVGETRRRGIEAALQYRNDWLFTYASYAFTDAEFRESLVISSPDNPVAEECPGTEEEDEINCVFVTPGDRLPGIPRHRFKAGFDYSITPRWKFGADLIAVSNQYFVGDEANQNTPLAGYAKVNLHTSYDLTENIQIYGLVDNVFNTEYGLFGTYFNAEAAQYAAGADPALAGLVYEEDNRKTILPAPPITAYGGVKVRF